MKRVIIVQDKPSIREGWVSMVKEEGLYPEAISGATAEEVIKGLRRLLALESVEATLMDFLLEQDSNCEHVLSSLSASEIRRMGKILIVSNADTKALVPTLERDGVAYVGPSTNWDKIRGALKSI